MMQKGKFFKVPDHLPREDEFFETLAAGEDVRIERIISHGHRTPADDWYDQETDEWVVLLQGEATLEWEDQTKTELEAGDWLLIPAGRKHRVSFTTQEPPCIWLAVHGEFNTEEDHVR